MSTAKEMWEQVKTDATSKSTMFIIDAKEQLITMKCNESTNLKTHLVEIKQHFKLMNTHCKNLIQMGSMFMDI
jgi:hypothetical protein